MRTALVIAALVASGCGGSGGSDDSITVQLKNFEGFERVLGDDGTVSNISPQVGDDAANVTYRYIFRFRFHSLPDDIDIEQATFSVGQEFIDGDPYSKLGSLLIDVVDAGNFLDAGDYSAPVLENLGEFSNNGTIEPKSIDVTEQLREALSRGRLDLMIRMPTAAGDGTADLAYFNDTHQWSGGVSTHVPLLIITYRGGPITIFDG